MHLKETGEDTNVVPGTNYSDLNQNNPNQYGNGASPYNNGQSPYGGNPNPYNNGQSPYGGNPNPYNNGQSPYGGNQGPYNNGQGPYGGNQGMNANYPGQVNNIPMGTPYTGAAAQKKSSIPVWLIVAIVILLVGVSGYFLYGKINSILGKADYIPGVTSGNSFKNDYFGFKSDFGSDWKVTAYSGSAETEKSCLDSSQVINEITAVNDLGAEVFVFSVEQTPFNVKAAGTDMDKLMDSLKEEFVKEMESSGYSVSNIERETMTIAGKTCEGIKMTGRVSGYDKDLSLAQFYMFKGNYVGMFSAVSTSEAKSKLIIQNNVVSTE